MRILAIGMGGAGCRIAAALYANDRKSSKVACVQVLVADTDSDTLTKLGALPEHAKIDFSGSEPDIMRQVTGPSGTATIDTGEIISRFQNIERGETDAIMICCGLGGRMADEVPRLISALRASVTEPIFGLVTLPALSEGEKRSAKAADDIDNISPLLDGTILFDNETWSKKTAGRRDELLEELAKPGFFNRGKNQPELSAQDITNKLLNQNIVRRISLILRAGEFRADGGIELAEVVMDSSEVLNTIKGMGFISIGYAVEHLSKGPLAFLSRLRTTDASLEQRKSAERIIELAKKAIYQEVSIPCDMTSAAKALILVAGPSHEISMKGFMTVRKWIDRSIAGMEMRSGDYPVTNSENVAIIVVLSGLENIPRLTEIREIREQYTPGVSRNISASLNLPPSVNLQKNGDAGEITAVRGGGNLRDEMISLSGEKPKRRISPYSSDTEIHKVTDTSSPAIRTPPPASSDDSPKQMMRPRIHEEARSETGTSAFSPDAHHAISGKPFVSHKTSTSTPHAQDVQPSVRKPLASGYEGNLPLKPTPVKTKTLDKQSIDWDQQGRQNINKPGVSQERVTHTSPFKVRISGQQENKTIIGRVSSRKPVYGRATIPEPVAATPEKTERTIIRQRKKEPERETELADEEPSVHKDQYLQEEFELTGEREKIRDVPPPEEIKFSTKVRPARDDIFFGKSVSLKEPLKVKDGALLHTEIKTKKVRPGMDAEEESGRKERVSQSPKKKSGKISLEDDNQS
ncbi:MAG: tubulin/FtsZ family protein [Methanoregula sp.]|uniref:tubulin/FtsZ family protein n=1 Tax=Methanoregula sp. TaxID=2052170 RepID=UPI003BAF88A0